MLSNAECIAQSNAAEASDTECYYDIASPYLESGEKDPNLEALDKEMWDRREAHGFNLVGGEVTVKTSCGLESFEQLMLRYDLKVNLTNGYEFTALSREEFCKRTFVGARIETCLEENASGE